MTHRARPDPSTPLAVSPSQRLWPPYRELLDVLGLCRIAPLDSPNLSKASYDQEPRLEVQVPYMAHLFGHRLARARRYQRSRLVIPLDQGVNRLSGPASLGKLRVLSAWIPARWSPLKRVTVLGQPAA